MTTRELAERVLISMFEGKVEFVSKVMEDGRYDIQAEKLARFALLVAGELSEKFEPPSRPIQKEISQ